jgi:hypothetical protein
MARRTTEPPGLPSIPFDEGKRRISIHISKAEDSLNKRPAAPVSETGYNSWSTGAAETIERIFGKHSLWLETFYGPSRIHFTSGLPVQESVFEKERSEHIQKRIEVLKEIIDQIDLELSSTPLTSSEASRGDRTQIPTRRTLRRPPIFLSHSTEERELVTKLIDTLINGLHLPGGTFFCSSVPGMGIPNGLRFIDYLRDTIDETRLVIFLVSPGFLESKFCLAESGAAWVKSVDQIILLTPSLRPRDLGGVFDGIQAANLGDKYALNELRAKICNALSLDPQVNNSHWERVRNDFLDYVAKLPPARLESAHPGVGIPEGIETPESAKLTKSSAPLSGEAQRLLSSASKDQSGIIAAIPAHGGRIISCGSQQFAQLGNPREQATWEAVLEELEQLGFIKSLNSKKNAYQITRRGYEAAELLSQK